MNNLVNCLTNKTSHLILGRGEMLCNAPHKFFMLFRGTVILHKHKSSVAL